MFLDCTSVVDACLAATARAARSEQNVYTCRSVVTSAIEGFVSKVVFALSTEGNIEGYLKAAVEENVQLGADNRAMRAQLAAATRSTEVTDRECTRLRRAVTEVNTLRDTTHKQLLSEVYQLKQLLYHPHTQTAAKPRSRQLSRSPSTQTIDNFSTPKSPQVDAFKAFHPIEIPGSPPAPLTLDSLQTEPQVTPKPPEVKRNVAQENVVSRLRVHIAKLTAELQSAREEVLAVRQFYEAEAANNNPITVEEDVPVAAPQKELTIGDIIRAHRYVELLGYTTEHSPRGHQERPSLVPSTPNTLRPSVSPLRRHAKIETKRKVRKAGGRRTSRRKAMPPPLDRIVLTLPTTPLQDTEPPSALQAEGVCKEGLVLEPELLAVFPFDDDEDLKKASIDCAVPDKASDSLQATTWKESPAMSCFDVPTCMMRPPVGKATKRLSLSESHQVDLHTSLERIQTEHNLKRKATLELLRRLSASRAAVSSGEGEGEEVEVETVIVGMDESNVECGGDDDGGDSGEGPSVEERVAKTARGHFCRLSESNMNASLFD